MEYEILIHWKEIFILVGTIAIAFDRIPGGIVLIILYLLATFGVILDNTVRIDIAPKVKIESKANEEIQND